MPSISSNNEFNHDDGHNTEDEQPDLEDEQLIEHLVPMNHYPGDTSEDEDEDESLAEPIQASLVLQIVSTKADGSANVRVNGCITPTTSRKASSSRRSSSRADTLTHPPGFVQLHQRSSSQLCLPTNHQDESPASFGGHTQHELVVRKACSVSHLPRASPGPVSFINSCSELNEVPKPDGINSVDFMDAVSHHTRVLESGLKELRAEMSQAQRVNDLGQEAIILSGLSTRAEDSLKHIESLYEETKYLKTYLDKMEAKVNYDIACTQRSPESPGWLRRGVFLASVSALIIYLYSQRSPGKLKRLGYQH